MSTRDASRTVHRQLRAARHLPPRDLRNALIEAGLRLAAGGGPNASCCGRRRGRPASRRTPRTGTSATGRTCCRGERPLPRVRRLRDQRGARDLRRRRRRRRAARRGRPRLRPLRAARAGPVPHRLLRAQRTRRPDAARRTAAPARSACCSGARPGGRARRDAAGAPAGAEVAAWSSVHGLAVLLLDGPLRSVPAEGRDALIELVVVDGPRGAVPVPSAAERASSEHPVICRTHRPAWRNRTVFLE